MSLETIKKLIWSSNMYFFGSRRIAKKDFYIFYGSIAAMIIICLPLLILFYVN
ncbi:hypothetical protein [Carnobacterium sp. AT7]|uniref:hypothetical protein n=1 Tax=Carnobacterium sp. AT7 TaxID=333990 RepID=UPI0003140CEF|nr:hypothetical protein [Carnobacterium sp. AT7]